MHERIHFGLAAGAARVALPMAILLALMMVCLGAAQAQTFRVIHDFTGGTNGSEPIAGLTMGNGGA